MEFSRCSHVGEAISSSGSRRFSRMMYNLIAAAVPVDEIRISELAVDDSPDGHPAVRSLGAVGAALARPAWPPPVAGRRCRRAGGRLRRRHARRPRRDPRATRPLHRHAGGGRVAALRAIPPRDPQAGPLLRDLVVSRVRSTISRRGSGPSSRNSRTCCFRSSRAMSRRSMRRHRPPHVTLAAPPATQSGRERVARRFAERLRQAGVKLSTREIEACTALLAGDTVPAIAMRFRAARKHRRDLPEAGRRQAGLQRASWPDALDARRDGRGRDGSGRGRHAKRAARLRVAAHRNLRARGPNTPIRRRGVHQARHSQALQRARRRRRRRANTMGRLPPVSISRRTSAI